MAQNQQIKETVIIPKDIEAKISNSEIIIKSSQGETKRKFLSLTVNLTLEGKNIKIISKNNKKLNKKTVYSLIAHLKNMIKGVQELFVYKLKICSSHFPMNVSVTNNKFIVKNFPLVVQFEKSYIIYLFIINFNFTKSVFCQIFCYLRRQQRARNYKW